MAKKKPSAGSRIKAQGRSLVWSTFTDAEKKDLRAAAGIAGVPMSQLVHDAAIAAVGQILESFRKSS